MMLPERLSDDQRWSGAVLVGGASRRMGAPKHEILLGDGRRLGQVAVDALNEAGASEVVLVGGSDSLAWSGGSLRRIPDLRPGAGALAALEGLLASGLAETWLVCPCDMPRLDGRVLRTLLVPATAPITIFASPAELPVQPLPMRLDARVLPIVRELLERGRRSLMALLESAPPHRVRGVDAVDAEGLRSGLADRLQDVDTPEDLLRFQASEQRRGSP
jgi:molybdopterin-guanine dinucleotide biosynthesis protein A